MLLPDLRFVSLFTQSLSLDTVGLMIETAIFLFVAAFLTLPSLISHKKEQGRDLLQKITPVQGGLGAILFIVALVIAISNGIAGADRLISERGIIWWLSVLSSDLVVLFTGFIISFALVKRLVSLKGSVEAQERAGKLFFKLIEFQTSAGFVCLVLGVWNIFYESVVIPVIRI